jgi:hypothetical protein
MKITVHVDGNRLFARATGQQAFELFAKSPLVFFAKVTPLEILFEAGAPTGEPSGPGGPGGPAEGAAPALTVKQAGRNTRAAREP